MNEKLKAAIKTLRDMPYDQEQSDALHIIRVWLNDYEDGLRAIKTGVYFEQERAYHDYDKKTIATLKEAQEYAAKVLRGAS